MKLKSWDLTGSDLTLALELPYAWRTPCLVLVQGPTVSPPRTVYEVLAAVHAVMALTPRHRYLLQVADPLRYLAWVRTVGADLDRGLIEPAFRFEIWSEDADCVLVNYLEGWSTFLDCPDNNPCNGTVRRWPLPNLEVLTRVGYVRTGG